VRRVDRLQFSEPGFMGRATAILWMTETNYLLRMKTGRRPMEEILQKEYLQGAQEVACVYML
jgi:hypothetical protein